MFESSGPADVPDGVLEQVEGDLSGAKKEVAAGGETNPFAPGASHDGMYGGGDGAGDSDSGGGGEESIGGRTWHPLLATSLIAV